MLRKTVLILTVVCCWREMAAAQPASLSFKTTDTAMQLVFDRARDMAMRYRGNPSDPVGPWYEAALPARAAFCMRDVSHQVIGAEILDLRRENKNMLTRFAENISAGKDWCSYWEINRYNRPAPEDYRNDREFWYNLNANFDVLVACWRLYLWTGDTAYINQPVFTHFFEKSVNEYITRWVLHEDSLLTRPALPNAPVPFHPRDNFHRSRGLASYVENVPDLKMGVDLVAAIYRGLSAYADMLQLQGKAAKAAGYRQRAARYRQKIDDTWWDAKDSLYFTHYAGNGKFGKGEGEVFLLWFDALADPLRRKKTIDHLVAGNFNVENTSYLPALLYEHGAWKEANRYMRYLTHPATPRREYPEVSYAVMESMIRGWMGIAPDAVRNTVATFYRGEKGTVSSLSGLRVLNTFIGVEHSGATTTFINNGQTLLRWKALFAGHRRAISVNGKKMPAEHVADADGSPLSFVEVTVMGGERITAKCL